MNTEQYKPLFHLGYSFLNEVAEKASKTLAIDIGANLGGFVEVFLDKKFECVHAFEPIPLVFSELRARFEHVENVVLNQLGISDKPSKVSNLNVFNAWTLLNQETPGEYITLEFRNSPPFEVEFITLDDYCDERKLTPTFLKIDVDGYEMRVLNGGRKTLSKCLPPIYFELSFLGLKIGDSVEDLVQSVLDIGYSFASLDGACITSNKQFVLDHFPYKTSYDVMLVSSNEYSDTVN